MENLRVDGQRLWNSLMEMAKIGATPKGSTPSSPASKGAALMPSAIESL
jgi:hypothetical protein